MTTTAKLFKNGGSQSVRLPKQFRLPGDSVRIFRDGDRVVLEPMERAPDDLVRALDGFSDDFMAGGRRQPAMQKRAGV